MGISSLFCKIIRNNYFFRVKILSAINKGKTETDICFFNYGECIEGIPVVFLIYGPRDTGKNYFVLNDVPSLLTYIEYKLGFEFKLTARKASNKNYIKCQWKVNIISRPYYRNISQIYFH